MTTVNRMISQAKKGASEVWIRPNEVRGVAEHFRITSTFPLDRSPDAVDNIAEAIRRGDLKILGVPVKVMDD